MLLLLFIGLGFGMLLLRSMQFKCLFAVQDPAMHMASVPQSYMRSPVLLRGFANQQRLPLPSLKPVDAMVDGSWHGGSWSVHTHPLVVRASENPDAVQRLQSALKIAEECVGECTLEFDNVEELSAEVIEKGPQEIQEGQISEEDLEALKATSEKLAAAREMLAAKAEMAKSTGKFDENVLKSVAEGMEGMKKVMGHVSKERSLHLDQALFDALDAAVECSGDECLLLWEKFDKASKAKAEASTA